MKTINALISASNVSVFKHHKSILKNIDIQINKNDFISLLMNLCNEEEVTLLMASHDKSLKKNFDMSINLERILL